MEFYKDEFYIKNPILNYQFLFVRVTRLIEFPTSQRH